MILNLNVKLSQGCYRGVNKHCSYMHIDVEK